MVEGNLAEVLMNRIKEQRKRIVVVGDAMVDRWVYGHLVPCQDGCEKFVKERLVNAPGGAANAHRCLSNWVVDTDLYSVGLPDQPIKTRFVTNDNIILRYDDETECKRIASGSGYDWARKAALEMIGCASGVLISDYDKGFLTPNFIQEVVNLCNKRRIPCVADAKRDPITYRGAQVKCNEAYYLKWCAGFLEAETVLTTFGSRPPVVMPMMLSCGVLGHNVECKNHVGAGDCFAAHLVLALAYGFQLPKAAALAHSAGRVYVQRPHNEPPLPVAIAEDLSTAM